MSVNVDLGISQQLVLPIVSAHDTAELAKAVAAAVDALIPCDHTGFYFLNPHTYQLDLVFAKGFEEQERLEAQASMDRRCLLYTSPSTRDRQKSRMPSSA